MVVAEDSEVATAVVDFGDAVVAMLRTKGEAKLSDKPGVQRSVLSVSLCLSNTFLKHLSQTHLRVLAMELGDGYRNVQ